MSETKILIVEDEAVTGLDIQKSLTEMGYSVVAIATTGELAVRKAQELHPDLILMDIMLAGPMTGIDAAEVIRQNLRIPVVYLTAYSDDAFLARARLTEPFGYILKPFRELELKTTIEMAIYKHAMEHALRVSEETTRVLLNATDDILFLVDTGGRLLAVNDSLAGLTRKSVRDLTGTNVTSLVTEGLISPRMAGWNMNITRTNPERFEEEFKGSWYATTIYPVLNPEGRVVLFAVYIQNISDTKKIAEQTRNNEEFFRSLLEDTSDIIAILNTDGTIRHESPSISRTLGYPADEIVNRSIYTLIPADDAETARAAIEGILMTPGMVRPIRLNMLKKDGSSCRMEGIISNLQGNPVIDGIVLNGWLKKE